LYIEYNLYSYKYIEYLLMHMKYYIFTKVRLEGELVGDPADVNMFEASGWVSLCRYFKYFISSLLETSKIGEKNFTYSDSEGESFVMVNRWWSCKIGENK
jgi:hypothetical protein